jgi:flagellar basal-body rod protein FlgB
MPGREDTSQEDMRGVVSLSILGGDFVEMVKAKMAWASQRQSILARNIANASTPDFLPSDLDERKFLSFLKRETQGAGGTLLSRGQGGAAMRATSMMADGETTPNGNGVNLERQMMKAAENSLDYQQAAGLYRKAMTMWRTALGRPGA